MNGAARVWLGGILSAIGVVCWSAAATVWERAIWEANALHVDRVVAEYGYTAYPNGVSADLRLKPVSNSMADIFLWAKDLRWAAMALALCGLVLLARGTYSALAFTILWLTGDVLIDRADVDGWLAMAMCSVVIGTLLFLVARAGLRERGTPISRSVALLWSAIAAGLASVLFLVENDAKDDLPAGMLPFAVLLSVSLLAAAVALALAARPVTGPSAIASGVLLVVLIGVPMIVGLVWQMMNEVDRGQFGSFVQLLPMLGAPLIVVGCRVLVRGRPTGVGWLGYAGLTVIASGAYLLVFSVGMVATYMVQPVIFLVFGDNTHLGSDGYLTPFAAVAAGLVLGAIVDLLNARRVPQAVAA